MGKTDKIIPFIIDGIAFAKNPDEECFPKAIRDLPSEQEILGANIGEMGREAAAVKVVAQMFGLRFDELWQRYGREKRKKKKPVNVPDRDYESLETICENIANEIYFRFIK